MSTLTSPTGLAYFLRPRALQPPIGDESVLRQIRRTLATHADLPDGSLRDRTAQLRAEWRPGSCLDLAFVVPGFALLAEAMRRALGIRLYDVQLLAGLALSRKVIAEMQTGEGKTLAVALPAFVYALSGRGVHAMTVNAYLAQRDYELLRPAYELLGLSTAFLRPGAPAREKRAAYACDITYGPGYEFGFDYLRDQMALLQRPQPSLGASFRELYRGRADRFEKPVQRGHHFAIIDEADSVMIDEATTPLILSGVSGETATEPAVYLVADQVARSLEPERDYVLDQGTRALHLTEQGLTSVRATAGRIPATGLCRPWPDYVQQALRAQRVFQRDVDYVIDSGTVKLVDENTGRIFADRSWRDGLRQAVEAHAGVPITPETQAVARISRQRYFTLYEGLCGLTGTARGSEQEFWHVHRLPVITIPLRTPSNRVVLPARFFAEKHTKWAAIVAEVRRVHETGQPVLVGTRTIEDSEMLAERLQSLQIECCLLNGKQDADEAMVVARAGQHHAITVATNMAGRGTDIKLDQEARALGGLHVIGCEQQESARSDRQLIGRCARQGDPGSCQMFVSGEDRLVTAHSTRLAGRMQRLRKEDGEIPVDLSPDIGRLQQRVERQKFAARRHLFARDHWLEEILGRLPDAN